MRLILRGQGLSMNEISPEIIDNNAANSVVIAQNTNQSSSQTQILEKK